jgi:hypothetical protein
MKGQDKQLQVDVCGDSANFNGAIYSAINE